MALKIEKMLDDAVGGLWCHGRAGNENIVVFNGEDIVPVGYIERDGNRNLVVALRNSAPALVALVKAARRHVCHWIYPETKCAQCEALAALPEEWK